MYFFKNADILFKMTIDKEQMFTYYLVKVLVIL